MKKMFRFLFMQLWYSKLFWGFMVLPAIFYYVYFTMNSIRGIQYPCSVIFHMLLHNELVPLLAGIGLSYILMTEEWQNRTMVMIGIKKLSYIKYMLVKIIIYNLCTVSSLLVGIFAVAIMKGQGTLYYPELGESILIFIVLTFGTITFPFVISTVLKEPLTSLICNVLFAMGIYKLATTEQAVKLVSWHPVTIQMNPEKWIIENQGSTLLTCSLIIGIGYFISCIYVKRCELK